MKNLVLIGMPGSGKTKMGTLLAQQLGLPFWDTDAMVAETAGLSIPEIFSQYGEARFRELETRAVREAAASGGAVIATGGGVVLREENMAALAETGVVFFRDRPVEDIAAEDHAGRPLVGADPGEARARLLRLYEARLPLYRRYAHYTIPPTDTYQEAAGQIAAIFAKEVL